KIRFNMHYHAIGREVRDKTSVGLVFYPKGYVPKFKQETVLVVNEEDLDIPPNTVSRVEAFLPLAKPTRVDSFQPHMHMRGKAMLMEAILPNGRRQQLSYVDHYDFNWQIVYVYAEDVAPLLPAGTVLHTVAWHDNTAAHRGNPNPNLWAGYGRRSI